MLLRLNQGRRNTLNFKKTNVKIKRIDKSNYKVDVGKIIDDSDNLKKKVRELINIHSKKSIYKDIPDVKKRLIDGVRSDLFKLL